MILHDSKRIERTLKRMSYQILEEAQESGIRLIGLNTRGLAVANRIKKHLEHATGKKVPLSNIKSDIDSSFTFSEKPDNNETLVIIDDVIFSGISMHRAISKIPELSEFKKVFIAVLVDRGHRSLPILASIVGVDIPTKLNEHVELRLKNNEPEQIVLLKK
jgi:pyrimidine operon attenuation protein / uracil phosphoribosyltransferase